MHVLGIESSCDETAAAVVTDGREIRSSIVESQVEEHAVFGGVVPEIAGRSHLAAILGVVDRALDDAGLELAEIDGLAVTSRPGLIGSLLVGLSAAKAIAWARDLPLVGIDHIQAHAYAATMETPLDEPAIALVVSGGHTALYDYSAPGEQRRLATTLDDAAGEAFDKVASMLGLGYPGGPRVAQLAETGDPRAIAFPRYRPKPPVDGGVAPLGFSFSGLKTAVLYHLRGQDALAPTPAPADIADAADVAASFQEAVVDSLVRMTLTAAEREDRRVVLVAGGVACNRRLREKLAVAARAAGREARFPSPAYCTDNAAMIAGLGYHRLAAGHRDALDLDASPRS
ncbi:MAG: tRNA (adenosine(37)-N6)-threonylcarbamoyltransferase complex transferase subunit TsaD [Planctomycetota bacterium]